MADAGAIVTNQEVLGFVPTMKQVGVAETLIIQAVEGLANAELGNISGGLSVGTKDYEDEEITIAEGELRWDQILVLPRRQFILKHRPVTEFTTLKIVSERSPTDGTPLNTFTVAPNAYHVDRPTGIVSLIQYLDQSAVPRTLLMPPGIYTSFPKGVAVMLATYTAGIVIDGEPPDTNPAVVAMMKLFILQVIARLYKLQHGEQFLDKGINTDFGTLDLLRVKFTQEEILMLEGIAKLAANT